MSAGGRFRYGLQPVLLTRQWEVDRLRTALAEQHSLEAACRAALQQADADVSAVQWEWQQAARAGQVLGVDRLVRLLRYRAERSVAAQQCKQALTRVQADAAARAAELASAQLALEAIEEHREQERGVFLQHRLSAECRAADELWIAGREGKEEREYES